VQRLVLGLPERGLMLAVRFLLPAQFFDARCEIAGGHDRGRRGSVVDKGGGGGGAAEGREGSVTVAGRKGDPALLPDGPHLSCGQASGVRQRACGVRARQGVREIARLGSDRAVRQHAAAGPFGVIALDVLRGREAIPPVRRPGVALGRGDVSPVAAQVRVRGQRFFRQPGQPGAKRCPLAMVHQGAGPVPDNPGRAFKITDFQIERDGLFAGAALKQPVRRLVQGAAVWHGTLAQRRP
jgi:hypothetical protein